MEPELVTRFQLVALVQSREVREAQGELNCPYATYTCERLNDGSQIYTFTGLPGRSFRVKAG